MILSDEAERRSVLVDLHSTLLVEAAAGTGKTSLIAGRVAMLLAEGVSPARIAAITFTEAAAGELSDRIRDYVDRLIDRDIPKAMTPAFPDGLSEERRERLIEARDQFDELTASTIHGFCHQLVMRYAVDIGLDPGSRMMDGTTAELLFEDVLNGWLTDCLSNSPNSDDPISVLAKDDPSGVLKRIRKLAELKRDHPHAGTVAPGFHLRPDHEFVEAIDAFSRWFAAAPPERQTAEVIAELQQLSSYYADCLATAPDFGKLWSLVHPPALRLVMVKDTTRLTAYRCRSYWAKASPDRSGELNDEATRLYDAVDHAYRVLRGELANALVEKLSSALDAAIESYTLRKREAALIDFDDLLRLGVTLVREPGIREELNQAFPYILVDEFQDTDRRQAEIIFSIASTEPAATWQENKIAPGGLFLVGDPKQGIYSFRGADIKAYLEVRDSVAAQPQGRVIQIRDSFRSRDGIVDHVNTCFEPVFDGDGQPNYVALEATRGRSDGELPEVSHLLVDPEIRSASANRDEEARLVAELCSRLIGAIEVERKDGKRERLCASDIALLAPTGADLWRYERALEAVGLVVASQAGKGLFLRQETQDVLALLRALADPTDRLAFIALMRGPLVGLTDEEILDIDDALVSSTPNGERTRRFGVLAPVESIANAKVLSVLPTLQRLHSRRHFTTPSLLLAEAVEALHLEAVLAVRHAGNGQRARANLGMLVELLRRDDAAGLQSAVQRLDFEWASRLLRSEGRVEPGGDALEIVTMHSSKGLEWPVVIPINSSTQLNEEKQFVYRPSDDTLHWIVGDVASPELSLAKAEQELALRHERKRMWYVACTRARDLLIIPSLPQARSDTWSRLVHLKQADVPAFPVNKLPVASPATPVQTANRQDVNGFAAEGVHVRAASPILLWKQPSLADADRSLAIDLPMPAAETSQIAIGTIGAGRTRGLVLHKLMEELITGEVVEDQEVLIGRAAFLLHQLSDEAQSSGALPLPEELGRTALATIRHPRLAPLRPYLVAEVPIWGTGENGYLLAGRVDAFAIKEGEIVAVIDWKSDQAPGLDDQVKHATQLKTYLEATRSGRGMLVYMSTQLIIEVH